MYLCVILPLGQAIHDIHRSVVARLPAKRISADETRKTIPCPLKLVRPNQIAVVRDIPDCSISSSVQCAAAYRMSSREFALLPTVYPLDNTQ